MRRSCLNALGRIEDRSALSAVREAMKDGDVSIRTEAVTICGNFNDKDSEADFRRLLASTDKNEQLAAAGALVKIGSKAGLSVALNGINDKEPGVRMNAANILGDMDAPEALSALQKAQNDKDEGVKQVAQGALQKIQARNPKLQAPKKAAPSSPKKHTVASGNNQ